VIIRVAAIAAAVVIRVFIGSAASRKIPLGREWMLGVQNLIKAEAIHGCDNIYKSFF
jgi:hypothetical protein